MSDLVMPWGKWKGTKIEDLTTDYIQWALETLDRIPPSIQKEMENQLELRKGHGVSRQRSQG